MNSCLHILDTVGSRLPSPQVERSGGWALLEHDPCQQRGGQQGGQQQGEHG